MSIDTKTLLFTIPFDLYKDVDYSRERRRILLLLGSIVDKVEYFKQLPKSEQTSIIVSIEKSCYDKSVEKANDDMLYVNWSNMRFTQLYQTICTRVCENLDPASEVNSSWLLERIVNKEIDIDRIAWMSSEQLTDKTVDIKQLIELRRSQKLVYKTSTMYTCRNCKGRKCTIRTQQMRSLDEGFTIIATCTICGFRFMLAG